MRRCKPFGSLPSAHWRRSPEWCHHRPLIPTWQGQQPLQRRALVGYALVLVLVPVRCKQIGLDSGSGLGLGSRRRGSDSRRFSCWYGSRLHPPRHHGLGQLLELTPTLH